jgi:hypothetical protein
MARRKDKLTPKTTAEKLVEQAEQFEAAAVFAPLIGLLGKHGRAVAEALGKASALAGQARELTGLRGRFNAALGARGWIAYEEMDHNLVRRAIDLAEAGDLDLAEDLLVESFDGPMIRLHLSRMRAVKAYAPRDRLLRLAANDYEAGRFHASIPVVFAQLDGLVADVAGGSLFHQTKKILPKLIAWDSMSAVPDGLPSLAGLLTTRRGTTTEGPLDVPYRHGILHGRDLGYDNKKVAAKTWAAFFAHRDWAIKFERGELEPPPVEPPPTLRETLVKLAAVERQRKAIDAWRARPLLRPAGGAAFEAGTPEASTAAWIDAWRSRDFEAMAEHTMRRRGPAAQGLAASLAAEFEDRELEAGQVVTIRDKAAAVTEVEVHLRFAGGRVATGTTTVVFASPDGQFLVRGDPAGRWGVNEALRVEYALAGPAE